MAGQVIESLKKKMESVESDDILGIQEAVHQVAFDFGWDGQDARVRIDNLKK